MIDAFRTRLSWQSFGAIFVLFALNAAALVLLFNAISDQQSAASYAQRAEQSVAASARLERLVVDMVTGVRGYLLTGKGEFLAPYGKALVLYPAASGALVQTATTAQDAAARGGHSAPHRFVRERLPAAAPCPQPQVVGSSQKRRRDRSG